MQTKSIQVKDWKIKTTDDGKKGIFSGYASYFGNIDSYGDMVCKGAFLGSLARRKPKMLWQHDTQQIVGSFQVAREDEMGLFVTGELFLELPKGQEAYFLMEKGELDGLSIGYRIIKGEWDDDVGVYKLQEVDLLEISIVTFPANELAVVHDIKSATCAGHLPALKDFEKFLRDAGGFSRSQATTIANHGLKYLHGERVDTKNEVKQLLSDLEAFNKSAFY